ncbi:hypothetical protein ACH5RR_036809 [Cinchona calisaya]|uniref:Uncharacterized protein n=1 Tax=Cinchona calisaya TaxID=153742 RepID=A0ABD2Y976_9GENT
MIEKRTPISIGKVKSEKSEAIVRILQRDFPSEAGPIVIRNGFSSLEKVALEMKESDSNVLGRDASLEKENKLRDQNVHKVMRKCLPK